MSKFSFCFSILLFHLSLIADAGALYNESNFWPPKVKLTQELELADSGKILPAGRHGVLIRVDQDEDQQDILLVDFGSNGIQHLRPSQTNVNKLVQKYKNGQDSKSFPNWTMMIGRAFVYVNSSSVRPIKLEELTKYKYMLFVYDDALDSEKTNRLFKSIGTNATILEEKQILVVVLPTSGLSGRVSYQEIQQICREHKLGVYYIYPYLSESYIPSLQHKVSTYPSCILTDMEGKTIIPAKYSFKQILQKISTAVP